MALPNGLEIPFHPHLRLAHGGAKGKIRTDQECIDFNMVVAMSSSLAEAFTD